MKDVQGKFENLIFEKKVCDIALPKNMHWTYSFKKMFNYIAEYLHKCCVVYLDIYIFPYEWLNNGIRTFQFWLNEVKEFKMNTVLRIQ